jgi:hypothetical protein
MSVIAELQVTADAFELGTILDVSAEATVELERMVPLGQLAVPFVRVHHAHREAFVNRVSSHRSVKRLQEMDRFESETLNALEWDVSRDVLFSTMEELDAQLMNARGTSTRWKLEIRFPSHGALASFHDRCDDADIDLTIDRTYNPTKPGTSPWFGLTPQQRETLVRAVEAGYYSIPRQISTKELAEEFGISD